MNIAENFYCSRCMREVDDDSITCPYCGYDPSQRRNVYALEEGTLLQNGRYQLGAVIGSGGFGITYAAWDITLNHPVAVKEYFPRTLCERDAEEDDSVIINPAHEGLYQSGMLRFIREARILATLQELKNIVPVLEWFEANNTAYIVMKYISGVTLEDYVKKNSIPPQKLIAMMRDIVDSLVMVHAQGIIHRDISPSNIMVQDDGTMTLIDFGAASSEERIAQGEDMTVIYNRRYAPIEQYDKAGVQGPFTDVYALSATIYHLICGEPPKESAARKAGDTLKSPRERHISIKKYQDKAIMNGLILQPEKRTPSMAVFRAMLYNLPMPEEVMRRRKFMFRVIAAVAAVSAVIVIAVLNFTVGFPLDGELLYSFRSDGLHVAGSISDREKISVPSRAAGISVVQVDEGAFQGLESLREAEIPGTVRTIDRFAFNSCGNLRSVFIGEGAKKLAAHSFTGCPGLQTVYVPSTLTDIDPEAFSDSEKKLVLLGDLDSPVSELADNIGLTYARIDAASNDSGITVRYYRTKQTNARIPDFIGGSPVTVIESGRNEAVFPAEVQSVSLPVSLDKIGDYAFQSVMIKSIDIPDGVRQIGRYAFSQSFIENIELPDSVISADKQAFFVCMYLKAAKLSAGMKEISRSLFQSCRALASVTIQEGIRTIGYEAFEGCRSLLSLSLPESVRRIDHFAFSECTSLKSIYLPPSLGRMLYTALDGCPNSVEIIGYKGTFAEYFCRKYGYKFYDVSSNNKAVSLSPLGGMWVSGDMDLRDVMELPSYSQYSKAVPAERFMMAQALKARHVILPENLKTLSTGSFSGNVLVQRVDCPSSLREIGQIAFSDCINLETISLQEGLEEIGIDAFRKCRKLTAINLPSTVKTIEAGAFEGCSGIISLRIPESLTVLSRLAFSETGIVSLDIPGNVVKCREAFNNCKSLRSVVFRDGLRAIWGTFLGCSELETVIIPASATQISRSAFAGCGNLRDVWIYSDTADMDYTAFVREYNTQLFADSPNLTVHAHRGSNAHMYATIHGINFSEIPSSGDTPPKPEPGDINISARVYTDEELIKMITPSFKDDKGFLWGKFQYALGYGFNELAYKCLDMYEAAGDSRDKIWASTTRRFLEQRENHGYSAGKAIGFFEPGKGDHPSLKVGDIIVEVQGKTFRSHDMFTRLMTVPKTDSKTLTILRADDSGVLRKIEVINRKGEPLFAVMDIIPKTFEAL